MVQNTIYGTRPRNILHKLKLEKKIEQLNYPLAPPSPKKMIVPNLAALLGAEA